MHVHCTMLHTVYTYMHACTRTCFSLQNLAKQILAEHATLKGLSGKLHMYVLYMYMYILTSLDKLQLTAARFILHFCGKLHNSTCGYTHAVCVCMRACFLQCVMRSAGS